jgi:HlyD family secretion protein
MTDTAPDTLDDFLGAKPADPRRKWLIRAAILLAVVLLVLLLGRCFRGEDEVRYATREAKRGDLTVTVSATGNLKPVNQVDVGSEQSGILTQVLVDVNDRVTRGQLLATLDTARLLDTVRQSEAQLASARASVAQADAQATLARATLARQEEVSRLSGGRVPSRTELDNARANVATALANLRSARAQVAVAQAQLSSAQINLSKARIVSPVNGVVLSRDVEPGQTVAASFNAPVLFTLAEDLKKMEVEVSVDEADVGQVAPGQKASFTVDAYPGRTFPALITRVNVGSNGTTSTGGSSATSASGSTVVSYTAVLSVANPDEMLRPGMTATADIIAREVRGALLIPNAALRFTPSRARGSGGFTSAIIPRPRRGNRAVQQVAFGAGSEQTVYVLGEDGQPRPLNVTIGQSDGTRTAVTQGDLRAGMRVITGQLAAGQTAPEDDGNAGQKRASDAPRP